MGQRCSDTRGITFEEARRSRRDTSPRYAARIHRAAPSQNCLIVAPGARAGLEPTRRCRLRIQSCDGRLRPHPPPGAPANPPCNGYASMRSPLISWAPTWPHHRQYSPRHIAKIISQVAAGAVGLARRAMDESIAYATQRKTMGAPIAHHQVEISANISANTSWGGLVHDRRHGDGHCARRISRRCLIRRSRS